MPVTWWLQSQVFFMFMLRELSCVFIGAYAVVVLVLVWKVTQGKDEYTAFLDVLKSQPAVIFHYVAFAFACLHTMTWFNATPQAMPVRIGEKRVSSTLLIAVNYVIWIAVSAAVLWILLVGLISPFP